MLTQYHLCCYWAVLVSLQNIVNFKGSIVELHLRMDFVLEKNKWLQMFLRTLASQDSVFLSQY